MALLFSCSSKFVFVKSQAAGWKMLQNRSQRDFLSWIRSRVRRDQQISLGIEDTLSDVLNALEHQLPRRLSELDAKWLYQTCGWVG